MNDLQRLSSFTLSPVPPLHFCLWPFLCDRARQPSRRASRSTEATPAATVVYIRVPKTSCRVANAGRGHIKRQAERRMQDQAERSQDSHIWGKSVGKCKGSCRGYVTARKRRSFGNLNQNWLNSGGSTTAKCRKLHFPDSFLQFESNISKISQYNLDLQVFLFSHNSCKVSNYVCLHLFLF